jgi:hypothetical protein
MIDVEVGGKKYQEMHVDGNTAAQVFVYPAAVRFKEVAETLGIDRERNLHYPECPLDPEWAEVNVRTLPRGTPSHQHIDQYHGRRSLPHL